jgi:hypothetical protein
MRSRNSIRRLIGRTGFCIDGDRDVCTAAALCQHCLPAMPCRLLLSVQTHCIMLAGPQSAKILARLLTDPGSFTVRDEELVKELEAGTLDTPPTAEQWAALSNSSRFYVGVQNIGVYRLPQIARAVTRANFRSKMRYLCLSERINARFASEQLLRAKSLESRT